LDKEIILQQFEQIEKKVEQLIQLCKSYEAKNSELLDKIKLLEEDLKAKGEAEVAYKEEKALIRSKIDSVLIKLEDVAEQKQWR
jgi:hypothetical protein